MEKHVSRARTGTSSMHWRSSCASRDRAYLLGGVITASARGPFGCARPAAPRTVTGSDAASTHPQGREEIDGRRHRQMVRRPARTVSDWEISSIQTAHNQSACLYSSEQVAGSVAGHLSTRRS